MSLSGPPNPVYEGLNVAEVDKRHNFRPFKQAEPSQSNIKTLKLESIDLSLFKEGPEYAADRKKLADTLEKSISTYGFFSLINHGISDESFDHIRSIAQSTLELPEDVKRQHLAGALTSDSEDRSVSLGGERGAGFKPKGYWSMKNGVTDSIELYNFRDMTNDNFYNPPKPYPEIVKAHLPEVASYFRHLHNEVLRKLTVLCDIVLQLPEGFLWENYFKIVDGDVYNSGGGFGRFMVYRGMKEEDEAKVDKNWLRGHSDSTAFTFITSQPILSLQIRDYYTGDWTYVGHTPGGLIVNVGDALEFITGGYFKSSIHRVVAPPEDQKQFTRLVLIYFTEPKLPAILDPEPLQSPKLASLGINKPAEWDKITFEKWADEKGRLFGKKEVNDSPGDEPNLVLMYGRLHERWHQAESNFTLEEAKKKHRIIQF
ncbi:Clavaminate synthase-like protein [Suhomyces tanzawaensis NRRL Y-17324]|uniref:Clavaminate synthase-like protein n=1 Tax=Suhomyces tanzawaensis NRRL Y-17324 TaxID=984487 RepID=A0A1E4SJM4_9ASCO|nr:Clavaminate synthase-like protein [Suhomyces tanzawaensis NRRL Y-17324]ODV79690.1 Clavaminate synthase-like protein [Suhomyces tanzawaensis NRRL Y-17324]